MNRTRILGRPEPVAALRYDYSSIIRNMKREEYTGTRPTEPGMKGGNNE